MAIQFYCKTPLKTYKIIENIIKEFNHLLLEMKSNVI